MNEDERDWGCGSWVGISKGCRRGGGDVVEVMQAGAVDGRCEERHAGCAFVMR